jgi:antitoxin VapB
MEGDRLIVEPIPRPSLLELLSRWEPLDEEFPDIYDLEPIEDVNLCEGVWKVRPAGPPL